jgi:nitrogen fixation protein FixH
MSPEMQHPHVSHRPFTGRHMAFIMAGFFLVVVSVNLTMAVLARQSWTGLVVQNSYVASQHFNEETALREAALALGYRLQLHYGSGRLHFEIADKTGKPLEISSVALILKRNASAGPDQAVAFECQAATCVAVVALSPGIWRGDLRLELAAQGAWQQAVEVLVKGT